MDSIIIRCEDGNTLGDKDLKEKSGSDFSETVPLWSKSEMWVSYSSCFSKPKVEYLQEFHSESDDELFEIFNELINPKSNCWWNGPASASASRSDEKQEEKESVEQLSEEQQTDSYWQECFGEKPDNSKTQAEALADLSHEPFMCPQCGSPIGTTSLMTHFLMEHIHKCGTFCVEIFLKYRCLQAFRPMNFELHQNIVMSLFVYGGEKNKSESSFLARGLAMPSDKVPDLFAEFQNSLPVMLVMCRTSMIVLSSADDLKAAVRVKPLADINNLWVLWLTCPKTVKPLYATVTVYDRSMTHAYSRILKVRDASKSQDCFEFVGTSVNFIELTYAYVKLLSREFTQPISMEIVFKEY